MRIVDIWYEHGAISWIFEHKGKRYCTPCFSDKHTYGDVWKAIDELRAHITYLEERELRAHIIEGETI